MNATNPFYLRQKWNRMRVLFMRVTILKIGDYTPEAELEVAEYFKLKSELKRSRPAGMAITPNLEPAGRDS